jgi:hypothetical protein
MISPTITDIERIAAITDPILRNLQITQCYHELALAMTERIEGGANWCVFATWASKQAGQTIRKEDLGRGLEATLGADPAAQQALQKLAEAALQAGARLKTAELIQLAWRVYDPQAAFERSSAAVARGNLKVFAEIGREFARFNATCLLDSAFDQQSIDSFCQALHPGEPPDGQRYLRQAFQHYYKALFELDKKARLELLLLGNLEIGFHEQTRLQPEINEALAAPLITPENFTRNLLKVLRHGWGALNDVIWYIMRLFGRLTTLDHAIADFLSAAQRQAQLIITETMMMIEVPPQTRLRLGQDLAASFPPVLRQILNADLLALLRQIDPTPDSPLGSGASYWGELADRLHFIADLFRSYQTSAQLLEPPFDREQTAALKGGQVPIGRL